jgi:hypothetical protein
LKKTQLNQRKKIQKKNPKTLMKKNLNLNLLKNLLLNQQGEEEVVVVENNLLDLIK